MRLLFVLPIVISAVSVQSLASVKETPPEGGPPKPFHLPPAEDFTLPNGMKVTIVPYGSVPKVAIRAYIKAGGVNEPDNQVWMSRLTALLMKEGTKTRSSEQIAQEAADMGGQLEINANTEYTVAGGVVLSEFGSQFINLLADVLQNPLFPSSQLTRLKADLERELAVDKSEPRSLARERFLQVLFPNSPYGRVFPSESALKGYTLEAAQAFYGANFGGSRTHLYIAGKLTPGLREAVQSAFESWSRGTAAPQLSTHPAESRSLSLIDRPGAAQSTLYMGLPVANPLSPDYVALDVMDALLGGSFVSRITSNIREQKGYTYSPFSQIDTRTHLAYWVEIADVTTAVTGPSLKEIYYEIDRMRKDPPSEPELKGIQNYLAGLFVLKNTISPDAIIAQLHFVDSQDLPRSFLSNYVQNVLAVKPGDIQRVAETYIVPSKMTTVVAGDKAKIADQLKPYEAPAP
ncbi:MAG: insulinase family protein [Acidobacteriaceae bacterium]|nr:insulinase family protein [Acidobacteriaceae bacterium]MBV9780289.1 insulinase family protein [Acidobacteriaceae bacterium]